jgi:hypothetical protein
MYHVHGGVNLLDGNCIFNKPNGLNPSTLWKRAEDFHAKPEPIECLSHRSRSDAYCQAN